MSLMVIVWTQTDLRDGVPAFVDEYRMLQNNPDKESADETLDIVPAEMALIKFFYS